MKRIVCLALILVLCLSMAACSMQKDNGFLEQPGISSEEGGFFDNFDINSFFGIGGKDTISGNVEQNEEDDETDSTVKPSHTVGPSETPKTTATVKPTQTQSSSTPQPVTTPPPAVPNEQPQTPPQAPNTIESE